VEAAILFGVDPLEAGVLVAEADLRVRGVGGIDEADGVVAVDVEAGHRHQRERAARRRPASSYALRQAPPSGDSL
jgi:hypothetical protein